MTTRQHVIVAITTFILTLAIVSYALRLYAKRKTAANVWWDDYMIGVGLVRENSPILIFQTQVLCVSKEFLLET